MNSLVKTKDSTISQYFTIETSRNFQRDMDIALKTMELMEVMKVLIKSDIILRKEALEFLEGFSEMMEGWQKKNEGCMVVNEVTTRGSRCIACEYGKDMVVYQFHYKHSEADEPYNRIVYAYEFGMMYDIQGGILHDLSICNAFLSKNEMQQLIE